jgi:hypothetical protein
VIKITLFLNKGENMSSIEKFRDLAEQNRFKGWPVIGEPELGQKIPFFGQVLHYTLQTGNGPEGYASILRHFGWSVVFGVTEKKEVITLCQWKPGVNQASWELPPGGIGKIDPKATVEEITQKTRDTYLKETGFDSGKFGYLGNVLIETGKFRGAKPDDHGLPAHLFLATDLVQIQHARNPNPNEIMETLFVPLSEFPEVLDSGLFNETSAVACAYKALIKIGSFVKTK